MPEVAPVASVGIVVVGLDAVGAGLLGSVGLAVGMVAVGACVGFTEGAVVSTPTFLRQPVIRVAARMNVKVKIVIFFIFLTIKMRLIERYKGIITYLYYKYK